MAARKPVIDEELEVNTDPNTFAVVRKKEEDLEPKVMIFLPALEDSGSAGLQVDQYEHVTIANEEKDNTYYIHRGEHVEVPVSVYEVLKAKYPNL